MGTQVFPTANGFLHLRAHSTDEDQPMVSANTQVKPLIVLGGFGTLCGTKCINTTK